MTCFDAEIHASALSPEAHNRAPLEGFYMHAVLLWPTFVRLATMRLHYRLFLETGRRLMS
jgi:hypothetical protein